MNRCFYISVCFFLFLLFSGASNGFAQETAKKSEGSYSQISKVAVDGDFCALKIKGYSGDSIVFKGLLKSDENLDAYKMNADVDHGVLSIQVIKPEQWKSHWGEIELFIPNNVEIDLQTVSGKIDVADAAGVKMVIQSKSGHVTLRAVKGDVSVVSPAGDIVVDNFNGVLVGKSKTGKIILNQVEGENNISTNKGFISASNVNGNLLVDGGSGSQEIENVKGNVSVKSTSGGVKISLTEGNVTCRIFTGDLKLFQTNGIYSVQSSTGNITGTRVKFTGSSSFSSTEGNIKVQMNTKSNLAFELKSDNSFLRAMGKSKKKSLKIGKGDIVITGISTTGSQAYY